MTQAPYPVTPARTRAPGPGLAVSLIVIAVGVVVGIASAIAIAIPLSGSLTSTVYTVPGTLHLNLHHNRYTVYQRTGSNSGFGAFDRDPVVFRIPASELSVLASDGTRVPVSTDVDNETITRGSAVYAASLEFDPPTAGDYELHFTNEVPTRVIVARSIGDAVESVLVWFGVGALGGLVAVVGIVMLIVGATRRGRAKRAAYAGWGGAPGAAWYGGTPQQWGTPGVTAPYPQQQYPQPYPPPGAYTPPGYAPPGYAPPPYPPPPVAYPPPAEPPPPDPPSPDEV